MAEVGRGWWTALPEAGAVRMAAGDDVPVGSLPLRLLATPATGCG